MTFSGLQPRNTPPIFPHPLGFVGTNLHPELYTHAAKNLAKQWPWRSSWFLMQAV
jgi:hypothetical protein